MFKRLKPYVSFSEDIKRNAEHAQEVVVGGEIKSIIRTIDFVDTVENEDDHFAYLVVDDGVGENSVAIPEKLFSYILQKYNLAIGSIVLINGYVNRLDLTHTYRTKAGLMQTVKNENHPESTCQILGFKLNLLPEEKLTLEKE